MATSSIYNNIKVTNKRFCKSLINALEDSRENNGKVVTMSRPTKKINKEQIETFFNLV